MKSLLTAIKNGKVLVSDGAWGTFLHERGLQSGECPEFWNVTHREDVFAIAKSYVDAGADMILTNSFGGSPSKLTHYGLQGRTTELNEAAAAISRAAAADHCYVLGSMGPTGVLLLMGETSEEELYDGFALQSEALKKGGVDAICVETMSAIDEACLAIRAAREATGLDVLCTFAFERMSTGEFRSMMGVSISDMVSAVKEAGASVIGTNCGNGVGPMIEIVREIREVDPLTPVLVHANAGKPEFIDGKTVFPESPESMAARMRELVDSGANIIGGCCGTTPAHIRALAKAIRGS